MNRQEKRRAFKSMGIIEKKNSLPPMHPDRCELRRRNREEGERKHRAMVEEMEKERYEQLENAESEAIKRWKKEGYDKKEIELLTDAFALDSIKNKETYQADKKKSKQLKKEALKLKQARLANS